MPASRFWTSKKFLIPVAVAILALAGWRFYAGRGNPDDGKDVFVVTRKDLTRSLSITGKILPVESMVIAAPQQGRVMTIAVQAGQMVKKDDLLFTLQLESRGQQDILKQRSEINRLRLEADAMAASLKDREGVRDLLATSSIVKDETELEKLRLELRAAEEAYEVSKREFGLGRTRGKGIAQTGTVSIRAPREGIVTLVDKRPGDYVGAGIVAQPDASSDRTVMVIADMSQLMVRTRVMEADLRYVEKGQPVTVKLEAFPDNKYKGRVLAIGGQGRTDKTAGYTYFDVDVSVDDAGTRALPEMNATVDLTFARKDNVLSLPVGAVALFPDRAFVMKRAAPGSADFVETPVDVGLVTEQDVEIVKGLAEGDEVREIDFAKVLEPPPADKAKTGMKIGKRK